MRDSLALDSAAANVQQTVKIADLAISTNSEQGYKLTMTSATGTLRNGTDGGTPIAYTVGISEDANAPSTFASPSGAGYDYTTSGANAPGTGDRDLYIRYTPAALQDPGTYSDTINLTVTDQ